MEQIIFTGLTDPRIGRKPTQTEQNASVYYWGDMTEENTPLFVWVNPNASDASISALIARRFAHTSVCLADFQAARATNWQ